MFDEMCCRLPEPSDVKEPRYEDVSKDEGEFMPEYVDVVDPVSEDEDEEEPMYKDEEEYEEAPQIKRRIEVDGVEYDIPYPWGLENH